MLENIQKVRSARDLLFTSVKIIGPLLDLQSLIKLHSTCKNCKILFKDRIDELKPYYLNGKRYKVLEELRMEYMNIPNENKRPEEHQPMGTMSWSRIDNSAIFLNLFPAINSLDIPSNYIYHLSQLGYDTKKSDNILDKWFDNIREGECSCRLIVSEGESVVRPREDCRRIER